jgi:hypothetical protein
VLRFLRRQEDGTPGGGAAPAEGAGNTLDAIREAGEDFLAAGDEAISRALSKNSAAFNSANRQQGGQ